MSASTNLTLTNLSEYSLHRLKGGKYDTLLDSTPSCSSQMCIVDSNMSIVCVEDKARNNRVLEEFSLEHKSLWIAQF